MPALLQQLLEEERFSPEEIAGRTREIYVETLRGSRHLEGGNFTVLHPDDLERLFALYDRLFFEGRCWQALDGRPLRFRVSPRMTNAGGKTTRYSRWGRTGREAYEITVSSTLLFQAFADVARPITVTGLMCRDRLEALQRIFEHELVHLAEMLVWTDSSCRRARFQAVASGFFGHTEHTHRLITPRERALVRFGIRPGMRVRFRFEGAAYVGFVHRVTKRATVLVADPRGARYSDGRRYLKFYVPIGLLELVDG